MRDDHRLERHLHGQFRHPERHQLLCCRHTDRAVSASGSSHDAVALQMRARQLRHRDCPGRAGARHVAGRHGRHQPRRFREAQTDAIAQRSTERFSAAISTRTRTCRRSTRKPRQLRGPDPPPPSLPGSSAEPTRAAGLRCRRSPGTASARFVGITITKSFTPMFAPRWAGANANGTYTLEGPERSARTMSRLRKLLADSKGSTAIEFAVAVPALIALYLGHVPGRPDLSRRTPALSTRWAKARAIATSSRRRPIPRSRPRSRRTSSGLATAPGARRRSRRHGRQDQDDHRHLYAADQLPVLQRADGEASPRFEVVYLSA